MDEKSTRTSAKQRIFIGIIALLMLGSFVAVYAMLILGGNGGNTANNSIDQAKVAELQKAYEDKTAEVNAAAGNLGTQYFDEFVTYKNRVGSYNSTSANEGELVTEDLKIGDGRELAENDTDYVAYYIGWCADEKIFDSSFDSATEPTSLNAPISGTTGFIEGWKTGVVGMKLGGVRELTIPSQQAYGEQDAACGSNQPLKFVVMTIEATEPLATLLAEQTEAYNRYYYYANFGIDYDEYLQNFGSGASTETSETTETTEETTAE